MRWITYYLILCFLYFAQADVLVNTTGENLNLDSNPCSEALSKNAGTMLQAECDRIGKLKLYEVAVTQGGNLPCNEVYHVVCVKWRNGEGEQVSEKSCTFLHIFSELHIVKKVLPL
jgi:O-acetyl-ADP-ribose deacetylase (regulator of RNase III)